MFNYQQIVVYIYNYWEIQSSGDTLLSFTQAKCPHLALDQILNSSKESIFLAALVAWIGLILENGC